MFKAFTFTIVFFISIKNYAFIPVDVSTALSVTGSVTGGLSQGIDLLETSEDLMNEITDDNSSFGQFTQDMKTYERELSNYESDLRYLGYSEEDIQLQVAKLGSSKNSLEQKMRALTKSIRNVKKIKNFLSKISQTTGAISGKGGGGVDPSNQAILANQQQILHLEIQQQRSNDMNELDKKMNDLAFKKSIAVELDKARIDLIKSKEQNTKHTLKDWSSSIGGVQSKAIRISLCLCVLGCLGLMVSFFREEGLKTLKAGFLGVILSYLLPSVVTLYSQWLGI